MYLDWNLYEPQANLMSPEPGLNQPLTDYFI